MIIAGPILMGAPKDRPLADQGSGSGRRPEEVGQQMTGFRGGERDERGADHGRLRGSSREVAVDRDVDEEGVGEQHEGEMTIPAEVAAHFIVVKAEGFGRFQVLFDAPARADGQPPWWAQGSRVAPRPGSRPTRVGRPGSGAPRANGDRRRPQHARWADEPSQRGARLWYPGFGRDAANPARGRLAGRC